MMPPDGRKAQPGGLDRRAGDHPLVCKDLSISFGGVKAVQGVSLALPAGKVLALVGPNGAGKTTLFNLIAGDLRPTAGQIRIAEEDVSALPTFRRAARGIGRTFQILTLFARESVIGNVIMALLGGRPQRWKPYGAVATDPALRREALEVLARVRLDTLADRPVSETSYGEKRRLEIAMALAQAPRILLLDEPLAGLSKEERGTVSALLAELPRDLTILMIEHDKIGRAHV